MQINEIENKVMKSKANSLRKINKIDKLLVRLGKIRDDTHINNIIHDKVDVAIHFTDKILQIH